ncbi:DUF1716-domain-containing protein [Hesseltinella vesiculosa]|uniref:DUF1716-domain-containing protein n=1 Tax=Hesseltinella vesiculosa TaxID=101127 RepID=A0A1X2G3A4_9FUNG|nr:DUF1716-domain-containing protein [Hesseltinella vesiculosa]
MNINDLFKIPSIPSGRNKRKMPATPEVSFLEKYQENHEGDNVNDNGKRRALEQGLQSDEHDYLRAQDSTEIHDDIEDTEGRFFGGGLTDEQSKLLDLVNEFDADTDQEQLTAASVKCMILKFEKAINKNQELRMRHSGDPTRFMESEADLDEEIKRLLVLTQAPHLYPELVKLNTIESMMSLLTHENTDIMIDAVEVINEWLDEDVGIDEQGRSEEAADGLKVLLESLLDHELLALLVQNLDRVDESQDTDRQGVFKILSIFENILSLDPELSKRITLDTKLPQWLLARLQTKQFDANQGYASELISILLQNDRDVRLKFCELNAVDICLRMLSAYKRKDPELDDEEEMVENLFSALVLLLNEGEAKELFYEAEGIELMLIMLKGRTLARIRAVKVLNYALSGNKGKASAVRFVQAAGLKPLFSLMMGKGNKKLKKSHRSFLESEDEEHILCIIVSLLRHLTVVDHAVERLRLINKFVENNYEKVERLVELEVQYQERDDLVNQSILQERGIVSQQEIDEEEAEHMYLERLDAGLFVLQRTCLVLGVLCTDDTHLGIKDIIDMLLKRQGKDQTSIMNVIEEETALLAEFVALRKIAMNTNPI